MATIDTPEPISAVVDLPTGNVWIRAGDHHVTVVDVRPTDHHDDNDVQAAEQTRIDYADGRLTVKAHRTRKSPLASLASLFLGSGSVDVLIELPAGSRVHVATAAGDLRTEGPLGECTLTVTAGDVRVEETGRLRVQVGDGDVTVTRADGHTDVTVGNGDIRIREVRGPVTAGTTNGDVTVGTVSGDLRARVATGDITVERPMAGVAAKTAYGEIHVREIARGHSVLESGYGDLDIGIREGTAAYLDINSGYGDVHVSLSEYDAAEHAEDSAEIRAFTSYGDIAVHRA
ncbi:DUF4097 family beta strand repeat-containing protein [Sinosporangium siamense]|uniref:DUF4097 domain-containing protein n=1 Tax=Sinosporangium siamense TaxID=1367973 RepID=A0A919RI06_9ACTN|nr:DUF4097 family beta strand repeat-containing protein [Sinosporangium siamense]GII93998.1 hypothetical protein Ssi02_42290 [Sinosporangium siamense]